MSLGMSTDITWEYGARKTCMFFHHQYGSIKVNVWCVVTTWQGDESFILHGTNCGIIQLPIRKTTENLSQDCWCLSQLRFNLALPEYKFGALLLDQSVWCTGWSCRTAFWYWVTRRDLKCSTPQSIIFWRKWRFMVAPRVSLWYADIGTSLWKNRMR